MEFGCVAIVPDEYAAPVFRVNVIGMKIQSGYKGKVTGYYYPITFTLKMETACSFKTRAAWCIATGYRNTGLFRRHISVIIVMFINICKRTYL